MPNHFWILHRRGLTNEWLQTTAAQIETQLAAADISPCLPLAAAVRYALLGGGKRLRPIMLIAAADNPPQESPAWQLACALECLHCYSLIHDDLPCMDNADNRRDKPSSHKAHGEAMALLAGDCLHALAFEMAAKSGIADAAGFLAHSAGGRGIVGGQARDIVGDIESEESFIKMYGEKTGALFVCAVRLGLLCRGNCNPLLLDSFAAHFGMLFQIINDINGEQDDRAIGKKTIVSTFGKTRAITIAKRQQQLAAAELQKHNAPMLAVLLDMLQL